MEWDFYDSLRLLAHALVGVSTLFMILVTVPAIFGLGSGGLSGIAGDALLTIAIILLLAAGTIYWTLQDEEA
jgi:hypothetical protein